MRHLLLGIALLATGCVSARHAKEAAYQAPAVSGDSATLVFIQHGGLMAWRIVLDRSVFLGEITPGHWFSASVPKGKHTLHAFNEDGTETLHNPCIGIDAEVDAGQRYLVMMRFVSGAHQAGDPWVKDAMGTTTTEPLTANDAGWTFRPTGGQPGGEPLAFLAKFTRLEAAPSGQAMVDEYVKKGWVGKDCAATRFKLGPADGLK